MATPVVISGAAIISPLGLSRQQTWAGVRAGRCGMKPLTAVETPLPPERMGGQAVDLPADFAPDQQRVVRYLRRAILDALADAGMSETIPYAPARCGIMLGTTLHGMRCGGRFLRTGDFTHLRGFLSSAVIEQALGDLPLTGFAATTCSACSSSLGSIALALTLLRTGALDMVVAGGYDPISEYAYAGFNSLRLVADVPLRPFAKGRQGMKLAEGYGIVVLERAADAERRGAEALALVAGCGESADAHHLTQPHPQGEGAARAMSAALDAAGLSVADIGLIVAHATGTPDNDASEHAALARTFGSRLSLVPVVAFKSHLGHTLGGAGAVELILAAMAMREQIVPPCANVTADDVEFGDMQLATGAARPAEIRATLSTSLGFGGANTCAILRPPDKRARLSDHLVSASQSDSAITPVAFEPDEVLITGLSVLAPGIIGNEAFRQRVMGGEILTADAGAIPDEVLLPLITTRRARRISDYVKLLLAATTLALQDAGVTDIPAFAQSCCAILGSMHGSTGYSYEYYGQIVREGLAAANPMLFAEGVPNAGSAHISLALGIKGGCQTLIGSRTSGLDAMRLAALRIASGQWDRAIVGAAEEYSPLCNSAYARCGLYCGTAAAIPFAQETGFLTGAGAAVFILESRRSADSREARARARVNAGASRRGKSCFADAVCQTLREIGTPRAIISSANATWIDKAEAKGISQALADVAAPGMIGCLYGPVAEMYSVTPLASLAAALLGDALPCVRQVASMGDEKSSAADVTVDSRTFGVLASDFSGLVSALSISRLP